MPSRSLASADYAPNPDGTPNVIGPISVGQITNANTTALEWTATVEGWPSDPSIVLFKLKAEWDNGYFAEWTINGGRTDQDGNPASVMRSRVYVPQGSRSVVRSGQMTLTVLAPFRSAFTIASLP